jgi:hypothetical protein
MFSGKLVSRFWASPIDRFHRGSAECACSHQWMSLIDRRADDCAGFDQKHERLSHHDEYSVLFGRSHFGNGAGTRRRLCPDSPIDYLLLR